ncbi:UNVERIFIED_CONTAM: hypothetical protein Sangu_0480000 [Sesamum angustifolium]|uniref:Retrovirus-related Pol polyprotein from transposon TNT 1-94 n=1 Tax=Sesamum angustifolium TaxID=2727405 RepID=A0AAW2Q7T7_9LAMI
MSKFGIRIKWSSKHGGSQNVWHVMRMGRKNNNFLPWGKCYPSSFGYKAICNNNGDRRCFCPTSSAAVQWLLQSLGDAYGKFLRSKEYWVVVENGLSAVADSVTLIETQKKTCEEQKLKDLKAKNYLFQALDRSILETIINKDTSKSIWDSMKQKYQGTTRVKRAHLQALRKEYKMLHMKEGESVNEYIARVLVITNKMKANGEDLKEVAIVEKILRSLTPNFNYDVCSIEESKDTSMLSIDELQSSLLVHEQRMSNTSHEEHALKWECKKGVANFAESQAENEEYMLLMAYVPKGEEREQRETDVWFLDSGCSNHMCGKREYFSDFDEKFTDSVKLGNNSNMMVNGKGNIRLEINGVVSIILGVFHVSELKNNLLSLGQLQKKGLSICFSKGNAIYIILKKSNASCEGQTPEEAWSGLKPPVQHFRILVYVTYVYIPDNSRTKLDEKSLKCVLLGISEESKAYRLYDPISRRIILECEDDEEVVTRDDDAENVIEEPCVEDDTAESEESLVPTQETSSSHMERRRRQQSTWLKDYVSGEGLSDEEAVFYLALFALYTGGGTGADPFTFE